MRVFTRVAFVTSCLLLPVTAAVAQTPVDPAGHWEGTVQVPDSPVSIEIDLMTSAAGTLRGTFAQPAQGIKALPLSAVSLEGRTVRFLVKGNAQGSSFAGQIAADGKRIAGEVTVSGYVIPFSVTRVGDARVAAAPVSPAISKELEGVWTGTISADGGPMALEVRLANRPDGTATGVISSPTGAGVEIPIAIVQTGKNVTLDVDAVGASFSGELKPGAGELAGTWNQSTASLPLTLTRVK
jgi:hypothetical protein